MENWYHEVIFNRHCVCLFFCVAVTTNSVVAASLGVCDVWVLSDDTFKT